VIDVVAHHDVAAGRIQLAHLHHLRVVDATRAIRNWTASVAVLAAEPRASKPAPRRQVFERPAESESLEEEPGNSVEGCPRPLPAPAATTS
jgi:hypothetical protein